MWKYASFKSMLYVHTPRRRVALMDTADSILEYLGLKNWLRAFRSIIGCTPPNFLGTTKILLKNHGLQGSFLRRALNCPWKVSIFHGSKDDVVSGVRCERRGGLSNST